MNMETRGTKEHLPIEREEVQKCNWDHFCECRHPEWWISAQNIIDSMNLDIGGVTREVENQFDKLKEGCKLCLIADLNRNLRLLSVRQQ